MQKAGNYPEKALAKSSAGIGTPILTAHTSRQPCYAAFFVCNARARLLVMVGWAIRQPSGWPGSVRPVVPTLSFGSPPMRLVPLKGELAFSLTEAVLMANHALSASASHRLLNQLEADQTETHHQITCACDGLFGVISALENCGPVSGPDLSASEVSHLLASLTAHVYLIRHQLDRLDRVFESGNQLINSK